MKMDIQVSAAQAQIFGTAKAVTILNGHVFDENSVQQLMLVAGIGPFIFKNQDIDSISQINPIIQKAKSYYSNLWTRQQRKLEPSDNFRFIVEDWTATRVEFVNLDYVAYPAGTEKFRNDWTVLSE